MNSYMKKKRTPYTTPNLFNKSFRDVHGYHHKASIHLLINSDSVNPKLRHACMHAKLPTLNS